MSFFEFPHTRTYDSDLGFIIKWIKEILPTIENMEEWIANHTEEYNELVARVDRILPEIIALLPDAVNNKVIEELERGVFQNLIINTTENIATRYINSLYDLTSIEALQTVDGEYILTVDGDYIFITKASAFPYAYTTNEKSEFYKLLRDASNKVKEGKKPLNTTPNGYRYQPPVLTLAHLSDYHGDEKELEYIYNDWSSVIGLANDWICTGDMVYDRFSDPFLFYPTTSNTVAQSTLLCIGNHDALAAASGYDWTNLATQQQQYDKFFAPTISHWNVVHSGSNTYYYKDYAQHHIRLIVLNDMLQDADMQGQLYWLENTALQTSFSVVIAKHYIPPTPVKIDCTFSAIDFQAAGEGNTTIADIVQRFIDRDGKFICYICGHSHYDYVGYLSQYPQQIAIMIDAAGRAACNQWSDVMRDNDEQSRDLFNMIQFDTSSQLIKIVRCGTNYDRYLRNKNVLCISYATKEIIYN